MMQNTVARIPEEGSEFRNVKLRSKFPTSTQPGLGLLSDRIRIKVLSRVTNVTSVTLLKVFENREIRDVTVNLLGDGNAEP